MSNKIRYVIYISIQGDGMFRGTEFDTLDEAKQEVNRVRALEYKRPVRYVIVKETFEVVEY
jgi:hypothetical protein